MSELFVNMGELKVLQGTGKLVTVGLGSCVGVVILDTQQKVAGLAHVFLADSRNYRPSNQPGKFADTAIPALMDAVLRAGGRRFRLQAKIAGGAHLFASGEGARLNVGKQNVEAVRCHLTEAGIPITGEDVGGNHGRKLIVHVDEGRVIVQAIGQPAREL